MRNPLVANGYKFVVRHIHTHTHGRNAHDVGKASTLHQHMHHQTKAQRAVCDNAEQMNSSTSYALFCICEYSVDVFSFALRRELSRFGARTICTHQCTQIELNWKCVAEKRNDMPPIRGRHYRQCKRTTRTMCLQFNTYKMNSKRTSSVAPLRKLHQIYIVRFGELPLTGV